LFAGKDFSDFDRPEIMASDDRVILFSNESWLGKLRLNSVFSAKQDWLQNSLKAIRNAASLFNDPTAILVIRQHGEWINSLYAAYLANGGPMKFDSFYGKLKKPHEFLLSPRCEAVREAFQGRALFLDFAHLSLDKGNWATKLSTLFGSNVQLPDVVENRRITTRGAKAARAAYRLNRLVRLGPTIESPRIGKRVSALVGGTPVDIGEDWKCKIDRDFADDWSTARSYLA
jgi:hypothetical protein